MKVDYQILLSSHDPSPMFERWRGGEATVSGYTISHGVFEIWVHRPGVEQGLRILCGDVQSFRGPMKWKDVRLEYERIDNGTSILRDRGADVEVVAGLVGASKGPTPWEPSFRGEDESHAPGKPYTEADLRVLDPIKAIRARPEMFFPNGLVSGETLAARVVTDAMIAGDSPVSACRKDGWWIIAGDDWFPAAFREEPAAFFARVVPFPEAGPNAMHAEVLLNAFARDVFTMLGPRMTTIRGRAPEPQVLAERVAPLANRSRIVGFRIGPDLPAETRPNPTEPRP